MKLPSLFAVTERQNKLEAMHSFLYRLDEIVNWELFRPILDNAVKRSDGKKGGRPPYDGVLMFKVLVLQSMYNLSDFQIEYQILDRLSFMEFLHLEVSDTVPDEKTVWLFREALSKAGVIETLFQRMNQVIDEHGFMAARGQMVDATFVEVPKQQNTPEENAKIKQGEIPSEWSANKRVQKDTDARWAKKGDEDHFGYKNHVNADAEHKVIRAYEVTSASVNDGQKLDDVLQPEGDENVWADSAYRSAAQEERLAEQGFTSHIHERSYRGKPLTEEQKASNHEKSKTRARIEHVFGHIQNSMHGCCVRTIGIVRAKTKIGLENMAYNIWRFEFLMRYKACP